MTLIFFLLRIVLYFVLGVILSISGHNHRTWQYWVVMLIALLISLVTLADGLRI